MIQINNYFDSDDLFAHIFGQVYATQIIISQFNHKTREELEFDKNIKTKITDKDMLLMQIDMALEANDKERFMLLTKELEGVE